MSDLSEEYDNSWLVVAVQCVADDYSWIVDSARNCTSIIDESECYIRFVDSRNANKPGSKWQFVDSIIIDESSKGELVLDILENNVIGGIELLTNVFNGKCP